MNIERFTQARKEMGMTQSELAEGICTQATLSRFENNGQIPNLKTLMQLCNKLKLNLTELFPKVGAEHSETIEKMNRAEFFLITSEYGQVADLLVSVAPQEIEALDLSLRYHYLEGFLCFFQKRPVIDSLFIFEQILYEEETPKSEIFRLLAYTGIGMVYAREKDQAKAEFYFNKVLERIYKYPARTTEDTWRVLHIVFQCGVFYSDIDELDISDALLNYAIGICSDNHVTYYLARAAIQLAKNAIIRQLPTATILELIYDARAYSKINRNKIALKELALMEQTVINQQTK